MSRLGQVDHYKRGIELTSTIFQQVQRIASDLFAVPTRIITLDSSPETIEKWDSLQHLNLVLALEERFGLQLSPEEIAQMHTIAQFTSLIKNKLQSARS